MTHTGAADGFGQVQEGMEGMSSALEQIGAANAKLGTASKKLSEGVSEALDTVRGSIDEKIDLVNALYDYVESQPAYGGSLSGMPTSTMYVVHAKSELTPLR